MSKKTIEVLALGPPGMYMETEDEPFHIFFCLATFLDCLLVSWHVRSRVLVRPPAKPLTTEKSEVTCLKDSTDLRTRWTWVLNPSILCGERVSTMLPTCSLHAAYLLSFRFEKLGRDSNHLATLLAPKLHFASWFLLCPNRSNVHLCTVCLSMSL